MKLLPLDRCFACLFVLIFGLLPVPVGSIWSFDLPVLFFLLWCTASPRDLPSLAWPWTMGLISDISLGTLLGEHGLSMVITAFAIQHVARWLRFLALWQQVIAAGLFAAANHSILLVFEAAQRHLILPFDVISSAVMTMVGWLIIEGYRYHQGGSR